MTVSPAVYGDVPPGGARAMTSSVAAVPVHKPVGLNYQAKDGDTIKDVALTAGDLGGGLLVNGSAALGKAAGPAGAVLSAGFSTVRGNMEAHRDIDSLLELYKEKVSLQLGKPAEQVSEKDLRAVAGRYPEYRGLRNALETIDARHAKTPVRSLVGASAALAGGAVGAIAGGGFASLATGMAGSVAASAAADKMFMAVTGDGEEHSAYVKLKDLEAKVQSGEGVSAMDMFAYHVSQDEGLARQIETRMGDRFDDLSDEKKARAMLRDHPMESKLAEFEAYLMNTGQLQAAALMDESTQRAVRQAFEQQLMAAPTTRIMAPSHSIEFMQGQQAGVGQGAFTRGLENERAQAPSTEQQV